jgi:hypothetical protein
MHESDPKPIRHEVLLPRREVLVVRGVVQGVGFRPFVFRLQDRSATIPAE